MARRRKERPDQPRFQMTGWEQSQAGAAQPYLRRFDLVRRAGIAVVKTHDLDQLPTTPQPHYPTLRLLKRGLHFLTDFAVDTPYPGDSTSKRQATSALGWAERVRTVARTILGIRPSRKK